MFMSGYTKHMCEKDITKAQSDLTKFLKSIISLLPSEYDFNTIMDLLKQYYPYELFLINEKYKYYRAKEKSLLNKGLKSRYKFKSLDNLVKSLSVYKKLISSEYKSIHKENFNENAYNKAREDFSAQRNPKIEKIFNKINRAKQKTQQMEPEFLDVLMGLYDKKTTSQKDKVYIMKELQKYYCPKVLVFFSKKVDTEYHRQLREMAFYHLQSLGFQPVLRKQKYMRIPSKNKKRRKFLKDVYAKQTFNVNEIPEELEYRLENSKEQRIKTYDFFISHSSSDHDEVQILIEYLNKQGKNIYCDWINDNDYLKRNLVGAATLNVITKRLQQSKELIFVVSTNSVNSKWCKYELNDFYQQHKNIYFITIEDIRKGLFNYAKTNDEWFIDSQYKNIELFNHQDII